MNGLSNWFNGLRLKLLVLIMIPVVLFTVFLLYSEYNIDHVEDALAKANTVRAPIIQHTGDMNSAANGVMRFMWTAYVYYGNNKERESALTKAKGELKSYHDNEKEYLALPRSDKMKELYKPVESAWPEAAKGIEEAIALLEKNTEKENEEAKNVLVTKVRPHLLIVTGSLDEMAEVRLALMKQETIDDAAAAAKTEWMMRIVGFGSIAILVIFGLFTASGLAGALTNVMKEILQASTEVSAAGGQLSSASQQVSSGATEAASALEETVSSIEELTSMVKLNAENAKQAASLSQASSKNAEEGDVEIKHLIESMGQISQSSKKIEEIINVIDDIAFQTNLLALNAAVEAARAGEQGKGFAVVAEAVRNLAQRSASAAKDINSLIKDSVEKIEKGTRVADSSASVLKNIVTSVKKVSDLNNEIASASNEQATGISQISKAMNELDSSTQQNASASEEVAASSEEMASQATVLQRLVVDLERIIDGGKKNHGNVMAHEAPAPRHSSGPARQPLRAVSSAPAKRVERAENVIPFDDEKPVGKVGTTDGF